MNCENVSPLCHDPGLYARDDGSSREQANLAHLADATRARLRKAANAAQLQLGVTIDEGVSCDADGPVVTLSIWDAGDVETIFKALKVLGEA